MRAKLAATGDEGVRVQAALARLPLYSVAYVALALTIIAFALSVDRSDLLDQAEYVDYFIIGPTLDWLEIFQLDSESLLQGLVGIFADEFLWRIWTTVVGALMAPTTAVLATILTLNVLLALAVALHIIWTGVGLVRRACASRCTRCSCGRFCRSGSRSPVWCRSDRDSRSRSSSGSLCAGADRCSGW